jgi:oleate hydratase
LLIEILYRQDSASNAPKLEPEGKKMIDPRKTQLWLVGGGIASMAAAVFAIRDAAVPGKNVHILEQLDIAGGSLDGSPAGPSHWGYVTRGGRELDENTYQTLWNLLESIPSLEDPNVSVRQEFLAFNQRVRTDARARLIDKNHRILDASAFGFNARDRIELMRVLTLPEHALGTRRIDEMFSEHFLRTNFWQMWRTMFAFQNWHSTIELRRYFLRLVQQFPQMASMSGVRRTKYNQYDSIVRPLQKWLMDRDVEVRFGTRVTDVDFDQSDPARRRAIRLHLQTSQGSSSIELGEQDVTMLTLGSITADTTLGGNDTVPELIRNRRGGDWSLWEAFAGKAKDFGRPDAFFNVDENKWESFTLTMHGATLLKRIVEYSKNEPGTGAMMSFVDSSWLMSIVVPYQPHFAEMSKDTYTLWGYGLFIDKKGDYVEKPMARCTGKDILIELIHQLGFEDIMEEVLASTDVTSVMLPYASAMFACRVPEDRPCVIPKGAKNFAFLGEWVELPEDIVYTVEYSVHTGMHAVYNLFGVDKRIPLPAYHDLLDPKAGFGALESIFK